MDNKNIIKKSVVVLVYISIIVFAVLAIYNHQQLNKLSGNESSGTVANNISAISPVYVNDNSTQISEVQGITSVAEENRSDNNYPDDLKAKLEATEKELDITYKQKSDEEARKAEVLKKASEAANKALEDPAFKKRMLDNIETRLGSNDSEYAPLFQKLGLSSENLDKLMVLMSEGQFAASDISVSDGMIRMSSSGEIADEYMSKINELLGDEDYAKLQAYLQRSGEVSDVTIFSNSLSVNDSLTADQKMELLDSWYESKLKILSEPGNEELMHKPSSEMTVEEIARANKIEEQMDEGYIEAAKNILSESQIEQLKAHFKKMRDGGIIYGSDGAGGFSAASRPNKTE